jgi:uncharacterized protein YqcC (DUF446 family)
MQLLDELEQQLRDHSLWQLMPSCEEALKSREPFAIDTLEPEQWLQWIFIPRMTALIEGLQPVPSGFSIAPYFSECWRDDDKAALLTVIERIDEVCAL